MRVGARCGVDATVLIALSRRIPLDVCRGSRARRRVRPATFGVNVTHPPHITPCSTVLYPLGGEGVALV